MATNVDQLVAGGLVLPVKDTGQGPFLLADGPAGPLARVANAAVTGELPGLVAALDDGVNARGPGEFAIRPQPDADFTAERSAWRALSGSDPGDDTYLVGTTYEPEMLAVPRAVLRAVVSALAARRAAAPPEQATARELELSAQELDVLTLKAATPQAVAQQHLRRRMLLADLAAAGLLAEPVPVGWRTTLSRLNCPALIGYLDAAAALSAYAKSDARRASGLSGPARVSLDWFRLASPVAPGQDPHEWLARWERVLTDSALGPGPDGFLLERTDGWYRVEWRRDDGETPVLLRVAPPPA